MLIYFKFIKKMNRRILCQLKSDTGEVLGAPIDLPLNVDKLGLEKICQALISQVFKSFHILKILSTN